MNMQQLEQFEQRQRSLEVTKQKIEKSAMILSARIRKGIAAGEDMTNEALRLCDKFDKLLEIQSKSVVNKALIAKSRPRPVAVLGVRKN